MSGWHRKVGCGSASSPNLEFEIDSLGNSYRYAGQYTPHAAVVRHWQYPSTAPSNVLSLSLNSSHHSDSSTTHIPPTCDMSGQSRPSGSMLQSLFEAALHNYEEQTGMTLIDHPLATELENCNSVESITEVLQEQARAFTEFRRDDSKVMKPLKRVVHVVHALSTSLVCRVALACIYFSRRYFYSLSPMRRQYPRLSLSCSAYDFLIFHSRIFLMSARIIRRLGMSTRAMMRLKTSSSPSNNS